MSIHLCGEPIASITNRPHFISYVDTTNGYHHAYIDRAGKLVLTRSSSHPEDPRCPACHTTAHQVQQPTLGSARQ